MKTIKSLKDITTLEVCDVVVFGDLKYKVRQSLSSGRYFLQHLGDKYLPNYAIFDYLNLNKKIFIENIGINARTDTDFPETKSLEALTAIVSALFKEYEKQNELPKTWEEFCVKYHLKEDEVYIGSTSKLTNVKESLGRRVRLCEEDRNVCTSKQEAEAFLALMQLRQLHKAYVKDWKPDWTNDIIKYCIEVVNNQLEIHSWYHKSHILSFPSRELVEQFSNNFKGLLEIAKPLL